MYARNKERNKNIFWGLSELKKNNLETKHASYPKLQGPFM